MEQANCASCLWLQVKAEPEEYRCQHGRFDKKNPRWFATSGITKPNSTVAQAQRNCPHYQLKTPLLKLGQGDRRFFNH